MFNLERADALPKAIMAKLYTFNTGDGRATKVYDVEHTNAQQEQTEVDEKPAGKAEPFCDVRVK